MRQLTAAVMAILIALSSAVQAADMARPVLKAVPPTPVATTYNWTGFYVGGHAGWGWAHNRFHDLATGLDAADFFANGGFAGGQIGYNWQSGAWVFGIEGEGSVAHIRKGVFGPFCLPGTPFGCSQVCGSGLGGIGNPLACNQGCSPFGLGGFGCFGQLGARIEEMALLTGRVGYAFGPWLAYAKAGGAYAHERYVFNTTGVLSTIVDGDRWGWIVGAGVEYGFAANWSAKLEYNFIDFGTKRLSFAAAGIGTFVFDHSQQVHLAKFGINYRFAPDVVVARY
jgi:outer membrane immunogenic protein